MGQKYLHTMKLHNIHYRRKFHNQRAKFTQEDTEAFMNSINNDRNKQILFEEPLVRKIFKVSTYPLMLR